MNWFALFWAFLCAFVWGAVLFLVLYPCGVFAADMSTGQFDSADFNSGGVRAGSNGGYYYHHTEQPGAYHIPGGTVIPGAAQNPGCGGGPGQYPCPLPTYIPDRH